MHPSFSGLLVTCAYFPHTTFPVCVTRPKSLTLTSIIAPFVITPRDVYIFDCGFLLTPRISRQKVVFSSGCVTCAFLNLSPVGLINRSYLGGFLLKLSPTNVTLLIILFHAFFFRFPDLTTWNISPQLIGFTFGIGTYHLPAFSFRFCLTIFDSSFVLFYSFRSNKQAGSAPFSSSSGALSSMACFYSLAFIAFLICTFSLYLCLLYSLALIP